MKPGAGSLKRQVKFTNVNWAHDEKKRAGPSR